MPAPMLDATMSMERLRDEIVWSKVACARTRQAEDQAKQFAALEERWWVVYRLQCDRWDAQTAAEFAVAHADDELDEAIDAFERPLRVLVKDDRSDPRYELYFDVPPSELKRPVLGPELESVRVWVPLLEQEEEPTLRAHHKLIVAAVDTADGAVKERNDADAANRRFRELGELATFWAEVVNTRDKVYATLDKRRVDNPKLGLPRNFAATVFRSQRRTESEEVRRVRLDAKAKARQDAAALAARKKEARQRLAEARKALKDLG